ncbi:hypothetical protein B0T25DRAFT_526271 [Lasiosphaeria hispida]|uniref:Uncharacterized protein n=1 Tax=Lasiosphaeria hispida TaxID=260671 RepID=A0AAJ0MJT3_9PEZI|nr:hypothetical protein B0T25DRAFT_526271 [Lasiosphaeria hispida]
MSETALYTVRGIERGHGLEGYALQRPFRPSCMVVVLVLVLGRAQAGHASGCTPRGLSVPAHLDCLPCGWLDANLRSTRSQPSPAHLGGVECGERAPSPSSIVVVVVAAVAAVQTFRARAVYTAPAHSMDQQRQKTKTRNIQKSPRRHPAPQKVNKVPPASPSPARHEWLKHPLLSAECVLVGPCRRVTSRDGGHGARRGSLHAHVV